MCPGWRLGYGWINLTHLYMYLSVHVTKPLTDDGVTYGRKPLAASPLSIYECSFNVPGSM